MLRAQINYYFMLQELGESDSAYSLCNQLSLNPSFAENGHVPDISDVLQITERMRKEWKV